MVFIYHGLGQVISAVVGGVALDGIDSNSPVTGPPSVLTATWVNLETFRASMVYIVAPNHESLSLYRSIALRRLRILVVVIPRTSIIPNIVPPPKHSALNPN